MSKEKKRIPELRFPEFEGDGEWVEEVIETLFKFKQGLQVPLSNQFPVKGNEMIRFIRIIDITSTTEPQRYIYNPGSDHIINDCDLFMIRYGTPGVISIGYQGVIANNLFRLIWKSDKHFVTKFWYYSFQRIEKYIYNLSGSSSMPAISFSTLESISMQFPCRKKEQQKIAACLSSLDDLITAHTDKLAALQDHKKGLMQNLFPQEGKKVPKYRFSGFSEEWEEKTIEDIAEVTTGNKDTQDKVEKGKYPFFVRSQTIERINSFSFDGEAILTSGDGVGVGKIYHYIIGKFDFHQRVYCLYNFVEDVDGKFVFYFFSKHFYNRVMQLSAKNSVDSVRRAMITEMPICLTSKTEQQKIAACLSALDELISAQTEKIEQLQQHKKGLMQGLFPKIER